jgi:pimeloyl-ACP methyl ester carboxylesterase
MQLATRVLGEGKARTLLFISGFVGSNQVWDRHFQSLQDSYRLLMIDTLGFGQSPKPMIEYSVAEHVAAIQQTLQQHQATHIDIVGHSMGCLLALAFAHQYPQHVDRLTLLALPYFENEAQARRVIREGSAFNRWLAMDNWLGKAACTLMCTLRPLLMPIAPHLVRGVPAVVARDALRHHWTSYSRTLSNVIFKGDSRRWLAQFAGPILMVHGSADTTAPIANVQHLITRSNVRFIELGATHGLIFSHSERIVAELRSFLTTPLQR